MTNGGMSFVKIPGMIVVALMLVAHGAIGADDGSDAPYTVECDSDGKGCRVDLDTYIGWRTYNGNCARCHGEGAAGSSLAPNLMKGIAREDVTHDRFREIVRDGVKGEDGVMPGWGENANVMSQLDQLWAYLNARTDGALPAGRPQKLSEKDDEASDTPSNWE